MLHRLVVLRLLFVVLFFASCDREEPITKEEAAIFAQKISKTVNNQDPSLMNDIIDADALAKKIAKDIEGTSSKSISTGVTSGLKRMQFGSQIVKGIEKAGFYHLVKQYEKEGAQHVLFCLYGAEGINYHDFELVKKKGVIKAEDVYIYLLGQSISEVMVETFKSMDNDRSSKVDGNSSTEIRQLIAQKKYAEAKQIFDGLPSDLKKIRAFRRIEIELLDGVGDLPGHKTALDSYVHDFPNSPDVFLLEIDACFEKQDYDGCLAAINNLDKAIASDPFLDYYRGLIYKLKEDPDSTKHYFQRVVKNYPEFGDGYIEMAVQHAKDGDLAAGRQAVAAYRSHPKFNKDDLETVIAVYPELGGE